MAIAHRETATADRDFEEPKRRTYGRGFRFSRETLEDTNDDELVKFYERFMREALTQARGMHAFEFAVQFRFRTEDPEK